MLGIHLCSAKHLHSLFLVQCRLIVSQMSGQRCELFNRFLLLLATAFAASLLSPQHEALILYSFTATVLLAHTHYGVSVVSSTDPLEWTIHHYIIFRKYTISWKHMFHVIYN